MEKSRKGISPVVATLLLIAVVVTLSAIVFIWATRFIPEAIQKAGMPAEQACNSIGLSAIYSSADGNLYVTNTGNIAVYNLNLLVRRNGKVDRHELNDVYGTITAGNSQTFALSSINLEGLEDMKIAPGILGAVEGGQRSIYKCENTFDVELA